MGRGGGGGGRLGEGVVGGDVEGTEGGGTTHVGGDGLRGYG
jgi:hypothetical protein